MGNTQGAPSTQLRKTTTIETTTPLAANQAYVGLWHDSDADGSVYVVVTFLANVASVAGSVQFQFSEDITDAGLTFSPSGGSISVLANTQTPYPIHLRTRYWRLLYQNGPTAQTSFKIIYTTFSVWMGTYPTGGSVTANSGSLGVQAAQNAGIGTGDNDAQPGEQLNVTSGVTGGLLINNRYYGGAFSGTTNAALLGWSKARTPTVFKQATASALGSTAVWAPVTGNKFRLLKYRIVVNASAIMAAATDLTIKLFDVATDIGQDYIVRIPAAALASGVNYDSGWVDLGYFGILSALANNALNVNLSAALTGGLISVLVAGTEE